MIRYIIIYMGGERGQTDNGPVAETETIREQFDSDFGRFLMGRVERANEDGGTTGLRAYEFILDPAAQGERRGIAITFFLRAAAAGYSPLVAPLVIPSAGYVDPSGAHPLTAVYWFLREGPDPETRGSIR